MKKILKNKPHSLILPLLLVVLAIIIYLYPGEKPAADTKKDPADYPVWQGMMEENQVNLQEARKAFDEYWKHNTHYKGDRSKQFEQWYTINSRRLDQYGNVISATQVHREFQRLRSQAQLTQHGQWLNYGPILVGARPNGDRRDGGRVKDVEFHPTDAGTYYVSCFKSGLFKTTDAGTTWTPLTDDRPEEVYIAKVLPSTPGTLFIGTNAGVLKSTDGGVTWNTTGLLNGKTNGLIIKSDNENIIIAGNDAGIYRSTNGGTSFTLVQAASKVEELRIHPTNPNIMYAGTNGSPAQFFRSTDGGISWTERTSEFGQGTFIKIAVTAAQPDYVYVINSRDHLGNDSFEGVYRSTDAGVNFTKRSGQTPCITGYDISGGLSRGQPNYNLFIVADPNNADILYAGGVKSWKSTDGGSSWTQSFDNVTSLGFGLHLDQLTWAHSPVNDKLFAVNDGGIYFLNANNKFQPITDGLPIAEVWECTQSQVNRTNVAGGTFHCGVKLNSNGTWYSPWGGDEATVLFDYSDDTYAYHFKYEKISRSTDGGFSFQRINPTDADRGWYTGTGVLDKSNVNTLFVGLFEVERSQNARAASPSSVTWTKISSFGGTQRIEKIEQADADHNILYVSREGNKFYRSDNVRSASPTFTDLTASLPVAGKVVDIATHPADANLVYILLGSQVYRSADKGSTWTNISNGLPGVALLEMVYDKSSDEGIYIGTDIGVYYKDATLSSWIDYSNGLPVIRISGMDIYYGATREESILTIATDGRGFWRSALNDVVPSAPVADFSADVQAVFEGNAVNFTDASTNFPVSWEWTFEGGEPASSHDRDPTIVYNTAGTYKVTLKAIGLGGTGTKEVVNYITVTQNSGSGTLQGRYEWNGDLNDASSYQRNLSTVGTFSPTYVADKNANPNSAYQAPGISGKYLTNGYKGIEANGARTVTAWIKTTTAGTRKTIVSWGKNMSGQMFNVMVENGNIRVEGGSCNVQNDDATVPRLDNNAWRHIAVTYDPADGNKASDIKLYIDGVFYANQPDSGDSFNSENTVINTDGTTNNLQIGNAVYNAGYYWRGELDDVRIYSEALSAQQILDIVQASQDLECRYEFDGDLTDQSSYQRDLSKVGTFSAIYVPDQDANPNRAYEAPAAPGKYLVNGYKGIQGDGARTVTAWIKTTTAGSRKTIVSWGKNMSGQMFNVMVENGNIRVEGGSCNVQNDDATVPRLDNNTWRHIAVTYDPADGNKAKDIKMYIDGVFYANQPDSGDSFNSETTVMDTDAIIHDLQVGNANYNANYYWRGELNDVRVYSKALTAQQILAMASGTSTASAPLARFSANAKDIVEGDEIQFTDSSTGSPNAWLWSFEGGNPASSTDQNPTVVYDDQGSYKVSLVITNELGSDTEELTEYINVRKKVVLDLEKDQEHAEYILYPNPASGKLAIQLDPMKYQRKEVEVIIVSYAGQKVFSAMSPVHRGEVVVDIAPLEKGSYFVYIKTPAMVLKRKMIKL